MNTWDCVLPLDQLWMEYRRICKSTIVLLAQTPYDKVLGMSNLAMLRYEWIWESTTGSGFLNSKRRPLRCHTNILVFYEHAPPHAGTVYNPQCTPGKSYHRPANGPSKCYNHKTNGHRKSGTTNTTGMRQPRSVILVKPKRGLHPRQKPVALMEYLIKTYSDKGNTVLDNCMGGGSTGVAAVLLKRGFIGIERDTGYFRLTESRIRDAGRSLEERHAPQT